MLRFPNARLRSIVGFASAGLAAVGAALYLWHGWCVFPLSEWNEMRLAPAFALRHGYSLYPLEYGGPLSTWIYGPVGVFLNLPATWAATAADAVKIAGAINLLTLVLPLAIVCLSAANLALATRLLSLVFAVLMVPANALAFQVADHASVAFGLLSCWCLVRSKAAPATPNVMFAALFCVLAISSKQIAALLPVGQLAWLWCEGKVGMARGYLAWLAVLGLLAAAGICAMFGIEGLWLNLVRIPARLPWAELHEKISLRYPQLFAYIIVPGAFLAVRRHWNLSGETGTESEDLVRCTAFAFVSLLPLGILAFFKIGGDTNVFHSWYYVMPALILTAVARVNRTPRAMAMLLVATITFILSRFPEISTAPSGPFCARLESGAKIASSSPGMIWFPYNPVITFYSDQALHHTDDGIATRNLAGLGLSERQFNAHLPHPLQAVAFSTTADRPFSLQLLPGFNQRRIESEWTLLSKNAIP